MLLGKALIYYNNLISKVIFFFRIAQDGLESIFNYIGKERKIDIPKEDLIILLLNDTPEKSPEIVSLSQVVQDQVKDLCKHY